MARLSRALEGEVAVVTGASSGIGAATARELGRRGATVVLAARREADLREQVQRIRDDDGRALAVAADLRDPAAAGALAAQALAEHGRVDVLVNNAGVAWDRPVSASPPSEIADLVQVDLVTAMQLTRELLPGMLERRHGAVICVGSLSGRVAMEPLYSAAKHGLRGFSLALRRQLAGSGVSVSLVSPGKIDTAMARPPGGPPPQLVADVIADLVSRPRREVVVPRRHYALTWLEQICPAAIDLACQWRDWSLAREVAQPAAQQVTRTP
jgi:NAD(P)-dependent dehydrogenase (short-subunit alcohol dehydrogenase family)